jgi:ketosteroid isomerase-like protein
MSSQDADDIRRITQDVTDGFNAGDVARMMRHYDDTYTDVNLPQPRQSRAERGAYYGQVIAKGVKIAVEPRDIDVAGDRAIGWGDLNVLGEGGEVLRRLRYLEIWRRTEDGWKAVCGMDSEVHD